jgi:hypothetical protein
MPEPELEQQKDIGKLWGELREFRAETDGRFEKIMLILTGVTGSNGMNGRIAHVEEKTDLLDHELRAVSEWGHKVVEVDRFKDGWCIGKKAVIDLEARLTKDAESREKETLEMRRTRYAMLTGFGVALITAAAPIVIAWTK